MQEDLTYLASWVHLRRIPLRLVLQVDLKLCVLSARFLERQFGLGASSSEQCCYFLSEFDNYSPSVHMGRSGQKSEIRSSVQRVLKLTFAV